MALDGTTKFSQPSAWGGNDVPCQPRPDLDVDLAVVRGDLAAILPPIERVFLGAGEHLGGAIAALQAVTRAFDTLGATVDSKELTETARVLAGIPSALTAAAATGEVGGALHRLDELAHGLERPLTRLRKTVNEMQVLAINARIEAAQVTATHTDFSVFTTEMRNLAEMAMAALDRLANELVNLVRLTASARSTQGTLDQQEGSTLTEVARRLRHSVDTLAGHRRSEAEAAKKIGDLARANEQRIGQVIGALQIGDIARQRIEHIEEALAALPTAAGDVSQVGSVCRLQAIQLAHTEQDLTREVGLVRETMAALMNDAKAMRDQGALMFGSAADGQNSFLHQLAADLSKAYDLMERYRRIGDALTEKLGPVARSVETMVTHVEAVHSIEADMRIMGLNATLKCGRLGSSGRALGVIAQELRAHAGRTADDAGQVMAGLHEIFGEARSLGRAGSSSATENLQAELRMAIATFDRSGETLAAALDLLARQADEAVARLSGARDLFTADMLAPLQKCISALDRTATELGVAMGDAAWAEELADTYTMASEREIHARFIGNSAPAADSAQSVDLDGIFF